MNVQRICPHIEQRMKMFLDDPGNYAILRRSWKRAVREGTRFYTDFCDELQVSVYVEAPLPYL